MYQPVGGYALNCTRCPPGHVTAHGGASACEACPAGSFAEGHGLQTCTSCAAAGFSRTTTLALGAATPSECVCEAGAWLPEWPRRGGRPCEACPAGAVCSGANALPVAQRGFWSSATDIERAMRDRHKRSVAFTRYV